jgi:site-specific DNA-cytosine methylase
MKGITVLSLFDGMSCGRLALERAGIKVKQYYASEIDKHAIKVTQHNYPDTIQLGSVTDINGTDLPKIDLLCGGSPCQSFSFAGKMKGMITKCDIEILTLEQYLELKSEGYRFEGQSYLFWEYMRILNEVKPKYFLLENVIMSKKWEKVLSDAIGIRPIRINSALVSAQNRKRLYFTNIGAERCGLYDEMECMIPQPKDKGILLKDILEQDIPTKYYLTDKVIENLLKYNQRQIDNNRGVSAKFRNPDFVDKMDCLKIGGGGKDDLICVASRGRTPENPKSREAGLKTEQMLEPRYDGKTNCITSVQKDNLVMQLNPSTESNGCQPYQQNRVYDIDGISPALMAQMSCGTHAILVPEATKKGYTEIKPGECFDFENPKSETRRGRKMEDKSNCLMAKETDFMHYTDDFRIRRLTPTECERLQTVPDQYSSIVSDTQRYKMLGNGWTVSVISHIFSHLPKEFFESELPTHSKADEWAFAPSCKSKEE